MNPRCSITLRKSKNKRILGLRVVLSALSPISWEAGNLLTKNTDFDSGPTTHFTGIQTNEKGQVPGWRVPINSGNAASSFTRTANDQGNMVTPNFAYMWDATFRIFSGVILLGVMRVF